MIGLLNNDEMWQHPNSRHLAEIFLTDAKETHTCVPAEIQTGHLPKYTALPLEPTQQIKFVRGQSTPPTSNDCS